MTKKDYCQTAGAPERNPPPQFESHKSTHAHCRSMAGKSARMRLTVEVLPLADENAHGLYRERAMAVFKGRRFALPVNPEDTLAEVWTQLEQRYKKNYLDAQQAANFTIKVLQDAYDCDLDLSDTVNDIFEGETDATMRLIKVVPSFVNRDFSVPPTSNLRPASEQKRMRERETECANKRRRTTAETEHGNEYVEPTRDQVLPSTETRAITHTPNGFHNGSRAASRAARSHSRSSLVFVQDTRTGEAEFGPVIKDESPELGFPPPPPPAQESRSKSKSIPRSKSRSPPRPMSIARSVAKSKSRSKTPQAPPPPLPPVRVMPPRPAAKRKDVYDLPSSEDERQELAALARPRGRPARTPTTVQKEVNMLNNSRQSRRRSSDLTTAFLNTAQTPNKPLSARKPNSDMQARLDRLLQQQQERKRRLAAKSVEPEQAPEPVVEAVPETIPEQEPELEEAPQPGVEAEEAPEMEQEPERVLETEQEAAAAPVRSSKSKSPTERQSLSSRASPTVTHNPARYLSRSPAAEEAASESSSSSDSDPSSSEDETEEEQEEQEAQPIATTVEDVSMPDATAEEEEQVKEEPEAIENAEEDEEDGEDEGDQEPDATFESPEPTPKSRSLPSSAIHIPSSPPRPNNSTPNIASSQLTLPSQSKPIVRHTPIPLPSNINRPNLSQRVSSRGTTFRTLREQLDDAKTKPVVNGAKAYDPRTLDVKKLAAKGMGKVGVLGVEEGEDSEDESSSSSSSSDSE